MNLAMDKLIMINVLVIMYQIVMQLAVLINVYFVKGVMF